jgi:hypothetical protein
VIVEQNLQSNHELALPAEFLKKAHLFGRVKIFVEENEIRIRNAPVQGDLFNKMRGLGESLFEDNAVTLQKNLRSEWKI